KILLIHRLIAEEQGHSCTQEFPDTPDLFEKEEALSLSLLASLSHQLTRMEQAQKRIADGKYGICEDCRRPIDEAQLQKDPAAVHCTACKRRGIKKKQQITPSAEAILSYNKNADLSSASTTLSLRTTGAVPPSLQRHDIPAISIEPSFFTSNPPPPPIAHASHKQLLFNAGAGLLAGLIVVLVLHLLSQAIATTLFIPPLVASAMIAFTQWDTPAAKPHRLIGGHLLSSLIALICLSAISSAFWTVAISSGLAIAAMIIARLAHPPASADPAIIIFTHASWGFLLHPVLIGSAATALLAVIWNRFILHRPYSL
ncbi:MAG: HPP family protein, partial [Firmicutes bacterium]|nr:HPP family protein [Bacillota bacterium]